MSSPARTSLSQVPVRKRRLAAATLGLFATLFVAIAAVAATGANTAVIKTFVAVAIVVAVFLALLAWGVAASIKADEVGRANLDLDAAIEQAVVARGGSMCDCGHDHDPTELHVPDDPCARDGHGSGCTHSCETCILSTLKRTSEHSVAARPAPRPSAAPPVQQGPRRPSPAPR